MRNKAIKAIEAKGERLKAKGMMILFVVIVPWMLFSCNPNAPWTTKNVTIELSVKTVSAGYVECAVSTDKNAYYLLAIEEAYPNFNPEYNQKQFMTLALDSAYAKYIAWRNHLLKEKEFNIAPFASHSLQYGNVSHFFTGLMPGEIYWIYAFVVNPETMQPAGKLAIVPVTTTEKSTVHVHFDYRIKGQWDYIYPMDSIGNINNHFPYIAATRDSADMAEMGIAPLDCFNLWAAVQFANPDSAQVLYGVKATENDGFTSDLEFEEGHTYYTAMYEFDGVLDQLALYKFRWTKNCAFFFTDSDSTNLARNDYKGH